MMPQEKKRRGRPCLAATVHTIHITLSLREGVDDDLIAFFAQHLPRKRAQAVITALRQGGVREEMIVGLAFDEAELIAALDDLLF